MPGMPTINIGNVVLDINSNTSPSVKLNLVEESGGGEYLSAYMQPFYPSFYEDTDVIGRKIKLWANFDDYEISPWWQDKTVYSGDIVFSNGHYYQAEDTGSSTEIKTGNIQPSHTRGVASDGKVKWRYLHSGSATATITSVKSDKALVAVVDNGGYLPVINKVVLGGIYTFKNIQWSIIGYKNRYPSHVYFHQNRMGLVVNTVGYGSWNCLSCSDDYFNFATEEFGQQLDTSAVINVLPDNKGGIINWVLSASQLYMGGYDGEYIISSGKSVITPTNIYINKVNETGGSDVVPVKYKELNLFVGANRDQLYTIGYDYTIDDYKPKEIGSMADHLLSNIKRLSPINNKDQNVYIVHGGAGMTAMKYSGDQKILSYSRITSAGESVVDFASVRGSGELMAYAAVTKGEDKITLQRVALQEPVYMFDVVDIESPRYNEKGEKLPFNIKDFGVWHHANKEVWVRFGEGLSQFKKVVLDDNGCSNEFPDSIAYRVGLPMVCELHTQPAFGQKVEGAQQQSIAVYLRLYKSGNFSYGSSVDFGKYFNYEGWADRQEYNEALALYTGDCMLNVPVGYAEAANWGDGKYPATSGVGINIKCDTPEPFNLLSIQEIYK
jgi:hypothetical protein